MKTIRIEGIGQCVSAVSLGLADIGTKYTVQEGYRLLDAYLDRGGNFLDTARVYSDWIPGEPGRSERILGDWMATGKRGHAVIATKGAHPQLGSMHTPRLSEQEIKGDLELSLKALRIDTIDLYYLHRDDRSRPVEEILHTLEACRKEGKIRRYACSNWSADRMLQAHAFAVKHGYSGFAANQVHWNLASANCSGLSDDTCVSFDKPLLDAFRSTGAVAAAWSALAHGYFTKLDREGEQAVTGMHPYHTPGNLRVYRLAKRIAADTGLSMTAVALQYLLCQPILSVAVVGCRTMEQLEDVMDAAETPLPAEAMQQLDMVLE